jgi:hypothetical protein
MEYLGGGIVILLLAIAALNLIEARAQSRDAKRD